MYMFIKVKAPIGNNNGSPIPYIKVTNTVFNVVAYLVCKI